ncbi:MAG TPA: alpha/beta hydrolase [Acidimicrobiia bacterium]|nr:alpha/beta hydrolase [Acidimicrobiia bacterium]
MDPTTAEVCFAHANGFTKALWRPIARRVVEHHRDVRWVSFDLRGHGDSGAGSPPIRWDVHGLDALGLLGDASGLLGVGHSMGGTALVRAELHRRGTFDRLVLIEPIVFPPPFERADIPLSRIAEKRRRTFRDRSHARERFAEGAFSDWDPEVLDLYVDHGFAPGPDGWTIKCEPATEADNYREGGNHDTWNRLDELDLPVVLVTGERSDTHQGAYLDALVGRFPEVELVVIEGAGHLVPMERPATIADLVAGAYGAQRPG